MPDKTRQKRNLEEGLERARSGRGGGGGKKDEYTPPPPPAADLAAAARAKKAGGDKGPNVEAMSDAEYKKFEATLPPLQRMAARKRRANRKTVKGTSAARAMSQ